ncbi:iron transporter [Tundrisphaera lichenicola]|uniref:iron transporter n=1 Tax=Tundrisphaera lichenicola TaxID=2029860 RepID=UPI003EC05B69
MVKSWTGPLITGLIVVGVGLVLLLNMQSPSVPEPKAAPDLAKETPQAPAAVGGQERPIGDPVEKNHIQVAAVYLSAVAMDGTDPGAADGSELIHLEADIKATEGNPNGFAKDEFVPYLKVGYEIVPIGGGPAIEKGDLYPMVAWDGLHYGANVLMPKAGEYRLNYQIQPPSAGGLGRHSDKATGVAPWWEPFQASFEWTVEPKAASTALAGSR